MKLVLFEANGPRVGALTARGVVNLSEVVPPLSSGQATMRQLIETFSGQRPRLEALAANGPAVPLDQVRLLPPLPWPGKILCSTAVYGQTGEAPPLLLTLKSAESVIGPRQTIELPDVGEQWQFVPEAELGVVIRGPAKSLKAEADDWRQAVFGYTCAVDVMARGDQQFGRDFWLAKADTLGPLGPCIVTADEVADPNTLRVRSWQNGQPRQDYSMATASASVPRLIEFATTIMTLNTGDVLCCGTSPDGLQPIADGDQLEVEIDSIGRLSLGVRSLAGSRV